MTRFRLGLLALLLAGQGCASEPTAAWNPAVWARNITPQDVRANYPAAARAEGVSGEVVLRCRTNSMGEMTNCRIMSETPSGHGFGSVALHLSEIMAMRTDVPTFKSDTTFQFGVSFNPHQER
ncbi:TonB family protein [Brevundimonas sp. NIBR10]|uniref:TonB family protein n=1 Tax=Brevundimonas sp. NIBR10 TaxID=3015997 RepID=UPI0022F15413|nr:TonB family protein [Brevundimonas sp. NIBR10]